jgi:ribosomal protein S18 acetylase RimI-like enzyme
LVVYINWQQKECKSVPNARRIHPKIDMRIREAMLEDAEELADVHIATWRSAYRGIIPGHVLDNLSLKRRAARWREVLSETVDRGNLVALAEGRIVGFASFGPARDEDEDPSLTAELMALYVHPEHWRRGVGTRLWQEVQSRLEERYREITLWVLCDNDRARRFYERIGFVAEADRVKPLPRMGADVLEVRYRRSLQRECRA